MQTAKDSKAGRQQLSVEKFTADDGDQWWSVICGDDLATGVMHQTREAAETEMAGLRHE